MISGAFDTCVLTRPTAGGLTENMNELSFSPPL